jgi:hypothetical protein
MYPRSVGLAICRHVPEVSVGLAIAFSLIAGTTDFGCYGCSEQLTWEARPQADAAAGVWPALLSCSLPNVKGDPTTRQLSGEHQVLMASRPASPAPLTMPDRL